jgi:hypothetical protein
MTRSLPYLLLAVVVVLAALAWQWQQARWWFGV